MSHYILNKKYRLPNAAVSVMASLWVIVISFTVVLLALLIYTAVTGQRTDNLPYAAEAFIGLFAVFAVVASLVLYVAMWAYWFIAERSSIGVRVCWFLALLFGVHYGAAIYAYKVWKKNLIKVPDEAGAGVSHEPGHAQGTSAP